MPDPDRQPPPKPRSLVEFARLAQALLAAEQERWRQDREAIGAAVPGPVKALGGWLGEQFTPSPEMAEVGEQLKGMTTGGGPIYGPLTRFGIDQAVEATTPGGALTNLDLPVAPLAKGIGLAALIGRGGPKLTAAVKAARARHLAVAPVERIGERLFLSTRVPRAVKAEAATGGPLVTGVAEIAQDPALLSKIAEKLRASPMLTEAQRAMNPQGVVDAITDVSSQNLSALIRMQPRAIRERASEWYPGGHRLANQFAAAVGVSPDQGAAVLATQSPSKEWHQNVDLAERIMRRWKEFGTADPVFEPQIAQKYVQTARDSTEAWIKSEKLTGEAADRARARVQAKLAATEPFVGRRWSELPLKQQARMMRALDELEDPAQSYPIWSPEGTVAVPVALNQEGKPRRLVWQSFTNLENAIAVLHDGSDANISLRVGKGHKVRSFFNNLNVPFDPRSVTVDTHNVGGAHFRPMGGKAAEVKQVMAGPGSAATGIKGAHGIYRDAMIAAAAAEDLRPSAGQSVSWEAIKGVFSPAQRRDKAFVAQVRGLWDEYSRGRMRLEDLHDRITDLAGGLNPPEWAK